MSGERSPTAPCPRCLRARVINNRVSAEKTLAGPHRAAGLDSSNGLAPISDEEAREGRERPSLSRSPGGVAGLVGAAAGTLLRGGKA